MGGTAVVMPRLGMTMEEGTVVEWSVTPGTRVDKNDILLVIETEKAESEIESTATGVLRHVYVEPGTTVPCGTLLAVLTEAPDEPLDTAAFAAGYAPPEASVATPEVVAIDPGEAVSQSGEPGTRRSPGGRRPIVPAARALARRLGLDLGTLVGTGPHGRVTVSDVEAVAAARERRVTVEAGVALEVLREGTGEPVVLLPGFGSDVSAFALQTPALAGGFRVIGVNPRGVGASDAPLAESYEVSQAARDLAAVAGEPVHLVGASLGAAVAIEFALSHPEQVRSLTLITPFLEVSPRLAAVAEAWCRVAAEATPETLASFLAPWFFGDARLADKTARTRTLRGLAQALPRVPPPTLVRSAAGMATWSGSRGRDLIGIEAPTLVLIAGADLLVPAAEGERIGTELPNAQTRVVGGAGHALAIDAAEAVRRALLTHLQAR